ncbi:MAG: FAD-dependent monooxygenase, partial [Alphaproteobacteria bacterium]
VGAGIQISPNGMKVLRALGLEGDILARGFLPEALEMRLGRSGFRIFRLPIKTQAQYRWRAPYVHIHRADLIEILAGALEARAPGCVRLGTTVAGLSKGGDTLVIEGGERVEADAVIAADGLRSGLRAAAFGEQPARFTGMIAWRGTVPAAALQGDGPPPTACIWAGPGRHVVSYYVAKGQLINFVGVVEKDISNPEDRESWRTSGQVEAALEDFIGWHPTVTKMIQSAQGLSQWALFDRPPSTQWVKGRMALVGDAAHPMLPTFAQGACQGLEDAWTVATKVHRAQDVATGLNAYARLRQPRTRAIQHRAMRNARDFHHQPGFEQIRAYGTLWVGGRFLPGVARGRLDEIYSYDAVAEAEAAAI